MASITASRAGFVTFMAAVPGIVASYNPTTVLAADAALADNTPLTTPFAVSHLKLEEDGDFMTLAFQGSARLDFDLMVDLLYKPTANNADFVAQEPGMVALLDTLFVALKADPLMMTANSGVPTTHYPFSQVKRSFLTITWGRSSYHGIRLTFPVGLNI